MSYDYPHFTDLETKSPGVSKDCTQLELVSGGIENCSQVAKLWGLGVLLFSHRVACLDSLRDCSQFKNHVE